MTSLRCGEMPWVQRRLIRKHLRWAAPTLPFFMLGGPVQPGHAGSGRGQHKKSRFSTSFPGRLQLDLSASVAMRSRFQNPSSMDGYEDTPLTPPRFPGGSGSTAAHSHGPGVPEGRRDGRMPGGATPLFLQRRFIFNAGTQKDSSCYHTISSRERTQKEEEMPARSRLELPRREARDRDNPTNLRLIPRQVSARIPATGSRGIEEGGTGPLFPASLGLLLERNPLD